MSTSYQRDAGGGGAEDCDAGVLPEGFVARDEVDGVVDPLRGGPDRPLDGFDREAVERWAGTV